MYGTKSPPLVRKRFGNETTGEHILRVSGLKQEIKRCIARGCILFSRNLFCKRGEGGDRGGSLLTLAGLLFSLPCLAQEQKPALPTPSPVSPASTPATQAAQTVQQSQQPGQVSPLTLERTLQQIGANYPKLLGAEADRLSARAKLLEKQGAFDPSVNVSSDYLLYNSTSTRGKRSDTTMSEVNVEIPTAYGLKFVAGGRLNLGAVKSPNSSTGDTGEYFAYFRLPLLRGAGLNEKSVAERQAALGVPLADQNFSLTLIDTLLKSANTYWKWVASGRKLGVQRDLLKIAQDRAKFVKDRADAGDLPQADVILAEREVQLRRANVIAAEQALQAAALDLNQFLFERDGQVSPTPTPEQVPLYRPNLVPLTPAEIERARKLAGERRPELRSLSLNRDITNIGLRFARNDRQPAVDLIFSPGTDTGYRSIGETMKAGVVVSIPLRTRAADGRIGDAQNKLEKIRQDERAERARISLSVDAAANAVNKTVERYTASVESLRLARLAEENERIRYREGDSTLFLVNQFERETATAASTLIDIEAEYEQALALFRASSVQPFTP